MAPPVMPLHSKAPLRCASTFRRTTYTRTGGFCPGANPEFQCVARQNPPVLWMTESVCSCPEQPLSATHGRQRYNTLDLASKIVCHEPSGFIGFFLPRRLCPPLDSSRQGSAAAFGNHCQGYSVPFGFPSQQGASRPYWITQSQRNCHPFGIPARFEMSTHKGKMVYGHSFQNGKTQKIPRASPDEIAKL